MAVIILRDGVEWKDCSADTVSAFHEIARLQGSSALWLCGAGLLVVPQETQEELLNFPYDKWRQEAIKRAQSGFNYSSRSVDQ